MRLIKSVYRYLEKHKSEAFEAYDLDLFEWYNDGQSLLYSAISGQKWERTPVVKERFFNR